MAAFKLKESNEGKSSSARGVGALLGVGSFLGVKLGLASVDGTIGVGSFLPESGPETEGGDLPRVSLSPRELVIPQQV